MIFPLPFLFKAAGKVISIKPLSALIRLCLGLRNCTEMVFWILFTRDISKEKTDDEWTLLLENDGHSTCFGARVPAGASARRVLRYSVIAVVQASCRPRLDFEAAVPWYSSINSFSEGGKGLDRWYSRICVRTKVLVAICASRAISSGRIAR